MTSKYPFFIRSTVVLLGLCLFVFALSQLSEILIPLCFAALLAILLNPLCNWLVKVKVPRVVAIVICLIIAIVGFGGLGYFVTSQLASFSDDMPVMKTKFTAMFKNLQHFVDSSLGIDIKKQDEFLTKSQSKLEPLAGSALSGIFSSLSVVFLLPVYIFLFLYYKSLLLNFLYEVFAEENSREVRLVLTQTKQAIQSFMSGLLLEALIVAVMNTAALLILGVKYAVLIGVLGALLNMLPYIGGIIAIALPVLIATITKDGYNTQLWVVVSYTIIQFIDNNILMPYIVSSKVKINALVSVVVILLGGALWGVSGMFLSIPFIGMLKIVFDRIPELKPWGKLLGTEIPTHPLGRGRRKKIITKQNASVIVSDQPADT